MPLRSVIRRLADVSRRARGLHLETLISMIECEQQMGQFKNGLIGFLWVIGLRKYVSFIVCVCCYSAHCVFDRINRNTSDAPFG